MHVQRSSAVFGKKSALIN